MATGPFLADLIVVLYSLIFIYLFFKNRINLNSKFNKLILYFIILCLLFFISSILSNYTAISLKYPVFYLRFIFFSACLLYFLKKEEANFENFFKVFFYIYSFIIIDSLIQFIFAKDLFLIPKPSNLRVTGVFGDELILGSYLSRLFPLYLISMLILKDKIKYNNFVFFILIVMNIFVIGISGERTALFYTFITIFFCIISRINLQKIIIISSAFSLIFLLYIVMTNNFVKERVYKETINQVQNTFEGNYILSKYHSAHYNSALKMFKDNPIFGVGPRNFRFECNKEKYFSKYACSTHPHNTYIQLLSETGILSTFMVLLLFLYCCFKIIKFIFKKNNTKIFQIEFLLYISIFISLWPLAPTGNFFNNWLNVIYFLPLPFLAYINEKNKNLTSV